MMTDITLYYAPDNASAIVRMVLEAGEIPYNAIFIDRAKNEQKGAEYQALNPTGFIPLIIIDGKKLFETSAILSVFGRRFPQLDFAPDEEASASWLAWIANELHAAERIIFYPHRYLADNPAAIRLGMRLKLMQHFTWLELNAPEWLLVANLGIHQCYLAMLIRWAALYGQDDSSVFDVTQWPRISTFIRELELVEGVRRTAALEGLGVTPFSSPSLPSPVDSPTR